LEKDVPIWYVPPFRLYVRPVPTGLVTVTTALPKPIVQSIVCAGTDGDTGCAGITTFDDADEMHNAAFVTVKV